MPPASVPAADVRAAAVVLGAGSGSRLGAAQNKVFLPLAGHPVIAWSFRAMARVPTVGRLLMVIREADRELAEATVEHHLADLPVEIVLGGASRHDSELAALRRLAADIGSGAVDVVLLHDGARPLVSVTLIEDLVAAARAHGAVFPGIETDEIRSLGADGSPAAGPVPRMIRAQTPQVFRGPPLLAAYEQAAIDGFAGTDTAACFQRYRPEPLAYLPGDPENIKVTYPEDLLAAEAILSRTHRID